jgi:hypothetical protein
MGFAKGHKKVGGRKVGTPNKNSKRGAELAQKALLTKKYLRSLKNRLYEGYASHMESTLWQFAFGRPIDPNISARVALERERSAASQKEPVTGSGEDSN